MKNNWLGKFERTITAFLPVSPARRGECRNCGACCKKNPTRCPLLRFDKNGKSYCAIWKYRPPQCRKYPRIENEQVIGFGKANCGYYFVAEESRVKRPAGYGFRNKLMPIFIRDIAVTDIKIISNIINFLNDKISR